MNATELSNAMSANYLQVTLTMGAWSGQVSDREAASELNASKQAVADASRVTKNLMAGADAELKAVKSAQTAVRTYVYANTLPLSTNDEGPKRGPRIVAANRAMQLLKEVKVLQDNFNQKLDEFCNVYDQRRNEALSKLGGLADPSLYPDASDIRSEFKVKMKVDTIGAATDFSRLGSVPVELADFLAKRKGSEIEAAANAAMDELRSRTLEAVQRMASTLGKAGRGEKTKMFGTLLTNLQTTVMLLRDTNLGGSDDVAELADRIERELLQHELDAYRGNDALSANVAAKAEKIADELDFDWMN